MLFQLLSVFLLGLLGGANPGPILTSSLTESLRKGFSKSLKVIFMAMIAESIVAIFILALFFLLDIPKTFFYLISFFGAGVLFWIALQIWRIKELEGEGEIFSFGKIFLLTVFNGPFWIFWITICVPQAFLLKEKILGGQFIFLIIFEAGWLFATVALTFIFSRFRRLLIKKNFISYVFKFFAILLFLFSGKLIFESIKFLFS
jgi:threonine/homoserine/homoserine lactone efflux protein